MIEIKFKTGGILISVILCFIAVILVLIYLIFDRASILQKLIICPFLITVIYVLIFRFKQLLKSYSKENTVALQINDWGIINNTQHRNRSIRWNEISEFNVGYYRTQQIYIKPKHPENYPRKKYFGLYFSSKPDILWIDSDILDIKREKLLNMLNQKLNEYKKQSINNDRW